MIQGWLGIDPGQSGGLAWLAPDGKTLITEKMPETERDIWETVKAMAGNSQCAIIEEVGPRPAVKRNADGSVSIGQGIASTATFMRNYGFLRGCLTACGVSWQSYRPQDWQKGLGLRRRAKGESQTAWKNFLKGKAQQLFPNHKITLATADSVLIVRFCQLVNPQQPTIDWEDL